MCRSSVPYITTLPRVYSVTHKVEDGYRKTEKHLKKGTTDRTTAGKYKQI